MNNKTMIRPMLACALVLTLADIAPTAAQSTLGGPKPPQNRIGGSAKPPTVVGGAAIHSPSPPVPPKPGSVVNLSRPGSTGTTNQGLTGTPAKPPSQTAGNTAPHPPVTQPNRVGSVATASSNLRCAGAACSSRSARP